VQSLAPHVSRWLLRQLTDPTAAVLPGRKYSFEAAVLWADVVSSTSLAERMAGAGSRGIEALERVLSTVFDILVRRAHAFGGDVIHFVGDAAICVWPLEEEASTPRQVVLRACAAALQIRSDLIDMAPLKTPLGPIRPAVRFGVGYGRASLLILGSEEHRLWMLDGPAPQRALRARVRALPNQVRLSPEAIEILGDAAAVDKGGGLLEVEAFLPFAPEPEVPPVAEERLRPFVHPALANRELVGAEGYAAEYRFAAPVFVRWVPSQGESRDTSLVRWVRAIQENVARFDGWLDNPVVDQEGYTLLIVFGAPRAHEDDVYRGVACALALRRAAASGFPSLPLRIGISRGRLFAGEIGGSERHTYTLLGDEINVASRLAEVARPGEVLVSSTVRDAVANYFVFRDLGRIAVRGKSEPVVTYVVVGMRRARHGLIEQYLARREQVVGRERELEILRAVVDRVFGGKGEVLTIRGEPGIGKSALTSVLVHMWTARGGRAVGGEGLPFARETPYRPWRWIVSALCGIGEEMDEQARIDALARELRRLPSPIGEEGYWVQRLPLLAELMGLKVEDNEMTKGMRGEVRRDNTFATVRALLWAKVEKSPLLLVIEDAQWVDDLSLQLAAYVAQHLEDHPLLLVLVHRPLPVPLPQPWESIWDLPHHTDISLRELSAHANRALLREQLGGVSVAAELANLVFGRTQGHPFFTEEMLGMLRDVGCISIREGAAVLDTRRARELHLPETVAGVIQARMDQLDEGCRLTLKIASVIGLTFSRRVLREVYPAPVEEEVLTAHLDTLERWGLVRLEVGDPEPVYAFRHAVTREVVYESLPLFQRRLLHEAIARWYEHYCAANPEPYFPLLAYHYGQAGRRERELHYLLRAAEYASGVHALGEAVAFYERALELLDPEREPSRTADVLMRLARRVHYLGQYERAEVHFQEALALYERVGDPLGMAEACFEISDRLAVKDLEAAFRYVQRGLEAVRDLPDVQRLVAAGYTRMAQLERNRGNFEAAERAIRRALGLAEAVGDTGALYQCYRALSLHYYSRGERRKALEAGAQVLKYIEAANASVEHRVIALNNQACFAQEVGEIRMAIEAGEAGLALARRAGIVSEQVVLASTLAGIYNHIGDWDAAERVLDEGWRLWKQSPHPYHRVVLWREGGKAAYGRGDFDAAIRQWSEAERASHTGAQQLYNAEMCACLALAWAEKGNLRRARRWAARARKRAKGRRQKGALAIAWRAEGVIERMRGNWRAAEEALQRSLRLAYELDDPVQVAHALLERGRLLLETGREKEGQSILRQAEEQAISIELQPVARAARALVETAERTPSV